MKISNIRLCFHILGATLFLFAIPLFLLALAPSPLGITLALLLVALGFAGAGIYLLAGAPHLTNFIKRKFPAEGRREPKFTHPRHGLKATIGLGIGMCFLLASGWMYWIGPAPETLPQWLGETLFVGVILAPFFMTWGAIHVAWFRGASPHGPLLMSVAGFVLLLFLPPVVAIPLMTVAPLILALCLPSRRNYLVGRWRRGPRQ